MTHVPPTTAVLPRRYTCFWWFQMWPSLTCPWDNWDRSHYIQHFCLCVQMSIESEMSHQRFRFSLQSGVWHLPFFFWNLLGHLCLCAACVTTTACVVQPCHFHQRKHPVVVAPAPPTPHPHPCAPILSHCLLFLSLLHYFSLLTSLTLNCLLSLCSTLTRVTLALSRWLPYTTPTPPVPPAPVWLALTLSAARRVPSLVPSSSSPPSPILKTCPAYPRSRLFRSAVFNFSL